MFNSNISNYEQIFLIVFRFKSFFVHDVVFLKIFKELATSYAFKIFFLRKFWIMPEVVKHFSILNDRRSAAMWYFRYHFYLRI